MHSFKAVRWNQINQMDRLGETSADTTCGGFWQLEEWFSMRCGDSTKSTGSQCSCGYVRLPKKSAINHSLPSHLKPLGIVTWLRWAPAAWKLSYKHLFLHGFLFSGQDETWQTGSQCSLKRGTNRCRQKKEHSQGEANKGEQAETVSEQKQCELCLSPVPRKWCDIPRPGTQTCARCGNQQARKPWNKWLRSFICWAQIKLTVIKPMSSCFCLRVGRG